MSTGIAGFDKAGKSVYLWDSRDRDTSALSLMNIKSGKSQLLAEHPKGDGAGIHFHPTSKKPLSQDFENIKKVNDGEANIHRFDVRPRTIRHGFSRSLRTLGQHSTTVGIVILRRKPISLAIERL